MKPWFGYHIVSYTFPDLPSAKIFDRVADLASAAENAGFSLVTVMDSARSARRGFGAAFSPDDTAAVVSAPRPPLPRPTTLSEMPTSCQMSLQAGMWRRMAR